MLDGGIPGIQGHEGIASLGVVFGENQKFLTEGQDGDPRRVDRRVGGLIRIREFPRLAMLADPRHRVFHLLPKTVGQHFPNGASHNL